MLMRHVAERREYTGRNSPGAGGSHRPAEAIGRGRVDAAADLLGAEASELPALLQWAIGFAHRHLDAEHGAELAGVEIDRLGLAARARHGGEFGANAAFFHMGWVNRRPTFETKHRDC